MKKRIVALLLSASMAIGMTGYPVEGIVSAAAYSQEEAAGNSTVNLEDAPAQFAENMEDWDWTLQEDGTVSIDGYEGNATQVEVPSMLDGREVTQIGNEAFVDNTMIISIVIPNTVKVIQGRAFEGCGSLTDIILSEGLASLGNSVFGECTNLTSIVLPESLERIGEYVFEGSGLKEIQIPNQVINIGTGAFQDCKNLKNVTLPDKLRIIEGDMFNGCYSLKRIEIPNQVTTIEGGAFHSCEGLESVQFSNSLEEIGENAFSYCMNLKEIEIPGKMKSIGERAFTYCGSLEKVVFLAGVETIAEYAFYFCKSLREVQIPRVINIGEGAFQDCSDLQKAIFLEGLVSIGDSAFYYCKHLEDITLPNTLVRIGNEAFVFCSYMTEEGERKGLSSITIPENVNFIGSDAFGGCEALKRIDVAEGNAAFCSVEGVLFNKEKTELLRFPEGKHVAEYEVPSSVEKIGDHAFSGYSKNNAGTIKLPETLKSIGESAFSNALGEKIVIPSGVVHIGEMAFGMNGFLIAIEVDAANTSFCSQDGVLFNKTKTELVAYPGGITGRRYSVPSGVTSILPWTFVLNSYLEEVLLPKSVSKIGEYAFGYTMDITILNPQCVIEQGYISGKMKIHGYENSTAQAYAQKYGIRFEAITGEICEHEYKGSVTMLPTCVKKGIKTITCTKCGDSYTDEIPIDLTAHKYTSQVTKPSTCSQKGMKKYTCSICGDSYTEEMSPIAHDYQRITVKATTSKDGDIQKKCKFCGDVSEVVLIAYPKTIALSKSSVAYNGREQKVSVKVKDSAGKVIAPANYSVSYSNNKNVGEATITVKFKGNYTGSMKKIFRILPKGTSLSKVSAKSKGLLAKWKKQAVQTNGYQLQYSTNSKFNGKDTKIVSIKKNRITSKSISKLKAKKKYYVRIRTYKTVKIKGKNVTLCSAWSKAKAIKTKK